MKAKSKIASIMEILISTTLFLIVLFVAVSSLINMNKNSDRLADLNASTVCSNQLEEKILNNLNLADRSLSGVWGIEKSENNFVIKEIDKMPGKAGEFVGIMTVESAKTGVVSLKVIYKDNAIYKYAETQIPAGEKLSDADKLGKLFKEGDLSKMFDCSSSDSRNVFSIKMAPRHNASSRNNFDIELNDLIYFGRNKLVSARAYLHEYKIYE